MPYADYINLISRTPITFCRIDLDFCANTFGSAPCTATGTQCFNSWQTCKDRPNYSRTSRAYKFTSADAPPPWSGGDVWGSQFRPYLISYKTLPTSISGDVTVTQRATIVMADEPDNDVGIDPYVSSRGSVPLTSFWRKLIARNPNYKNRIVTIYDRFRGMAQTDPVVYRFVGKISSIKIDGAQVTIEATDLLLSLENYTVPPNSQVQLASAITSGDTSLVLSSLLDGSGNSLFPSTTGYVRIGDEIVYYSGINVPQNTLTGCTRGAYDTVAAAASLNAKVQPCKFYSGNPFDILQSMMLDDAAFPSAYVDSAGSWTTWKTFPQTDINFDALISEPTNLKTLFWEIANLMDLKIWVAEDMKVMVSRGLQNAPGTTYTYLTDAANIIDGSAKVDTNDASAITRATIFYHQSPIAKADQTAGFARAVTAINADAESANGLGVVVEQRFLSRWVSTRYQVEETVNAWVAQQAAHMIFKYADTQPILTFDLELKDQDVKTGQYVKINTDEVLDRFGNPINGYFLVTSRNPQLNKLTYQAIWQVTRRWAFQAPNTVAASYANASDADKQYCYQCDANGNIGDEKVSYLLW